MNCVVCNKPREATIGLLCLSHRERIGAMLREVEDEAAMLDARPSISQRIGSGHGSLPSERAPAKLNVLVHTDHRRGTGKSETDDDANAGGDTLPILDVLHSWARVIREERGLTPPDAVTVTGERDLLSRHLDWVAGQPWVDEAYADVRRLLSQLRIANETQPDKPYSQCPVIVDNPCPGQVWIHDEMQPVWRRYADRCSKSWEYAPGAAVCDTCGSSWATDAEKARLRRMIDDAATELVRPRTEDGRPMLTRQELMAELSMTWPNVRVVIHRKGLVAVDGHYDPAWFRDKATA